MKKLLLTLLSTLFVISFITAQTIDTFYVFPIKPGTDEWKKFSTHDEMVAATQIPLDTLKSMNTINLINTCLKYPLLMDVLAFDNMQYGFEATFSKFNGFQELKNRTDAGNSFLKIFSSINIEDVNAYNDVVSKGTFAIHLSIYEMMVTDSVILSQLTAEQQIQLLKDIRGKLRYKENNKEIFGAMGKYTSVYALSKVLLKLNLLDINDNDIIQFSNKMLLKNINTLDRIILITDNVL